MGLQLSPESYRKLVLITVYAAIFIDNVLLTVVVPILPHYLRHGKHDNGTRMVENDIDEELRHLLNSTVTEKGIIRFFKLSAEKFHRGIMPHETVNGESTQLGILLSLKAVVQIVANPVVAVVSSRRGFTAPLLFGVFTFLLVTMLFAFGRSVEVLACARALQGISSACFTITGLGLIATTYKSEPERSSALGCVMGGMALGVVVGYPAGGFLYQVAGKTIPLATIAALGIVLGVLISVTSACTADSEVPYETIDESATPAQQYRHRKFLLFVAVGGIFLSTAVIALLEPCLPIWLMDTMQPERWELGAVFIPDSIGYLLGAHFMGGPAYRWGRWKVSLVAMIILGVSCTLIPLATSVAHLIGPHFGIGLGLGTVDAALVPLQATLAESQPAGKKVTYGATFAVGQTAVSLSYCLGPLLGGFLEEQIGFPTLIISVGILNLVYAPLLITLIWMEPKKRAISGEETHLHQTSNGRLSYRRLSEETDTKSN